MNNAELKEFFDSRFKSIDEKIDTNHCHIKELLENIEIQTTKTNGRVTVHDAKIQKLELDESRHVINCPRIGEMNAIRTDITELKKENELWRLAMKYPKMALVILTGGVLLIIGIALYYMADFHQMLTAKK